MQVVGLLRRPLVVPHLTDRATLNLVLGVVIGETLGYLFTAVWTVAIVRALRIAPWLGRPAAMMIATGVLTPVGRAGRGRRQLRRPSPVERLGGDGRRSVTWERRSHPGGRPRLLIGR
ncbi:hypothetical protein UK23_17410 [Lentzea aerocolonigenes]|uniref:Uncharacterized protein n=1 Tax=Lentzea aerocolonigenes TaxID=68170 RepID=A0A0F0GXW6_LENAE|nr:hypothetical protein [Lentzea aerocolonigenes]KJK48309.1 hypothetical protein UK23_17410 [Lentzea aerocolonigenes]